MQNNDSTVMLDPVEYGRSGQWAISIWFRPNPSGLVGDQFEYIFSQGRKGVEYEATSAAGYLPDQVGSGNPNLLLPAKPSASVNFQSTLAVGPVDQASSRVDGCKDE